MTNEYITSEQALELAKIRKMGMEDNKNFDSIKRRKRREFWNSLGLQCVE